ncbi:N-acetyl-alpha-D-glucosaminyl L-malate synthase BshA [Marinococcus halophilus]|uniref:N-acetyl-alpha-D-glucosaminyl L-malate synthase BshA n=1 Tax=Marinococcus halophilus TaxID=1371 RepID=UPI0009A87D8B|nr:N-acetyl-alpha-D-glucosaminyl L-malate synthase BshA [Marinococcus halophilus]OZT80827.1 N-acetyl-alpha-D-glucosaminyl L-malate synthase BshA [Marinococcus halophilus]
MKIGITCYPTVGGSGVIATELGKLLAEQGHEIHFITSAIPYRLTETSPNIYYHEVSVNQYEVFQYPPYSLTLASKMAEVVNREQLDVLHVHYAVPHAVCAILARDMTDHPVKVVTTLHGTDITVLGHDSSLRDIIRYAIQRSDEVTAVSDALVNQTRHMLEVDRDIHTIYNFVDERVYAPKKDKKDLKKAYNIDEDEKVLLHVSNFRPVKRVVDVVRTFAAVQTEVSCKLVMLGDGPDREKAWAEAKKLGVDQDVLFLGNQREVADYLHIADLMLLLSEKESFGLAALEAMACGVPVIGTDVGGIPEVVFHNETGYVVPLGAVELAAQQAVELLLDPDKMKRFEQRSLDVVEEHFSSSRIVTQYEEVYRRTMGDE